ncbi:MAG: hypothetical protein ACNI27_03725 [Desulfovibrio sp.]
MTDEEKAAHDAQFVQWALQGNSPAVQLVNDVSFVAHLWDDLIDGDKQLESEHINWAFWVLFVQLQENPFYVEYREQLVPIFRESILAWIDSSEMEKEGGNSRCMAYTLRTMYDMIITTCAYIIGGYTWMREVSAAMRRDMSMTDGTFDEYMAEMDARYGQGNGADNGSFI